MDCGWERVLIPGLVIHLLYKSLKKLLNALEQVFRFVGMRLPLTVESDVLAYILFKFGSLSKPLLSTHQISAQLPLRHAEKDYQYCSVSKLYR